MRPIHSRVLVAAVLVWAASLTSGVPQAAAPAQAAPRTAAAPQTSPAPQGGSVPAAAAPAAPAELQQAVTKYCAGCHNERSRTAATATGVVLDRVDLSNIADHGDVWEKVIRKMRAGAMPPAGMPRPDAAHARGAASPISRRRSTAPRWHGPNPGPASAAPPEPRGVRQRHPRPAGARGRRRRRCCRRTIRPTASTTSPTCSACRRRCSSATCRRRRRSARSRWAARRSRAELGDLSRPRRRLADRARTTACRSARAAACWPTHTFPLDGEYVIKVKLLETNLGSIRGLEDDARARDHASTASACCWRRSAATEDYVEASTNATNVVNCARRHACRCASRCKAGAAPGERGVPAASRRRSAPRGCSRSCAAR